ncbi:MAG: tetratricopeptide repeat protein [Thermodesulfobacteriota bacterium]
MIRGKIHILVLLAGILMTVGTVRANPWVDMVNQGMQHAGQGDYDQAIALFTEALGSDQLNTRNRAITYSARAGAWSAKGDDQKALADYTTAIAIDPAYVHAYNNRAVVWQHKGEYDKAIADYTRAVEVVPGYAAAYTNRGNIWKRKGEYEKAVGDYSKAISLDPAAADAFDRRGRIYFYCGQYGNALADFAAILNIKPQNVYNRLWHHITLDRVGDKRSASLAEFRGSMADDEWAAPLVRLFLGKISPEECLKTLVYSAPGASPEQTCKALFYTGEYYLMEGDAVNAKVMFMKCLPTHVPDTAEYEAAQMELDRLTGNPRVLK